MSDAPPTPFNISKQKVIVCLLFSTSTKDDTLRGGKLFRTRALREQAHGKPYSVVGIVSTDTWLQDRTVNRRTDGLFS